ncbi:MAG: MBOAT family O-acyltransferase [Oscillospiraceae bacterium]
MVLIAFSMFFYAWGEPIWISLLLFSAAIDYVHGLVIEKYRGRLGAKLAVASSLVLNLGLLGIFKYSGFLYSTLNSLFGLQLNVPAFALPIGISFYTFQTISYTIDVYRGDAEPQHSFAEFLMYVSLYFQLVAGPIVRYRDVAVEINHRHETVEELSRGFNRFCIGLGKKVLIANTAGRLAAPYLDGQLASLTTLGAWFGIILFALQIYYDFSGYSDMAIGLGWIFGFHFLENFNYPYVARSATEFWRRWHISLGSFFRDYLYIPLGGNRRHQYLNLLITWFATGLWHGASWNFVLWGLFYGALIMLERLIGLKRVEGIWRPVGHLYLILAMLFGWVLFYFTDLSAGIGYMGRMLGLGGGAWYDLRTIIDIANNVLWLLLALVFCAPVIRWLGGLREQLSADKQRVLQGLCPIFNLVLLLLCTAMLVGQSYNPFLYYRF